MKTPKRVALIAANWPKPELFCTNFNGMQAGLKTLGIPFLFLSCRGWEPDFRPDIDKLVAYQPDLVIYALRDMIVHKEWREEIRRRLPNATIVMWYGDYRDERTTQVDANCSVTVDVMFVSNDAQEQYYKSKWRMPRVEYLPLGCEPTYAPREVKKFEIPFVFVGGQIGGYPFQDRAHLISRFKGDAQLTIINSFEPKMRAKIMQALPEIYGSAKVTLDISHFTDKEGYTSNRFWIIPAYWGFALTKRWPGCETFYPEDTRVYFDTFEEAIEKRDYYLSHEEERLAMVKKAHERSYLHTYDKRFLHMFSLL